MNYANTIMTKTWTELTGEFQDLTHLLQIWARWLVEREAITPGSVTLGEAKQVRHWVETLRPVVSEIYSQSADLDSDDLAEIHAKLMREF